MSRLIDLHEDIAYYVMTEKLTALFSEDAPARQADIPKYRKAGIKLVFASIFPMVAGFNPRFAAQMAKAYRAETLMPSLTPASPRDIALEQIKTYYALEESHSDALRIVRTAADLIELLDGERIGLVLHLEGCEALTEPEDLRLFYALGVRSIGLTWNYDNKYAASCFSKKDYGLTGEGFELIKLANRLGVIVDLSHASPKTCSEALDASESPPCFSHANAYAVVPHERNVKDELLKRLGERLGVIGLTFIRACIGEPATSAKLAEHARHMANVAGERALALGTDFLGITETPDDLPDITHIPKLETSLLGKGLSPEAVAWLFYENALRFLKTHVEKWG